MTPPARGDAAATGTNVSSQPPPALLVRMGGRWMCRHELAELSAHDGRAPDVQLRP
jgi:hypothetical protein